jgi:hypothetical protein
MDTDPNGDLNRVIDRFQAPDGVNSLVERRSKLVQFFEATGGFAYSQLELNIGNGLLAKKYEHTGSPVYLKDATRVEQAKEELQLREGATLKSIIDHNGFRPSQKIQFELARDIITFYKDAARRVKALQAFGNYVDDMAVSIDPTTGVGETKLIDEWSERDDLRIAVGAMLENNETALFTFGSDGYSSDRDYMADDPEVLHSEQFMLMGVSIQQLVQAIEGTLGEEFCRKQFWSDQVQGRANDPELGVRRRAGLVHIQSGPLHDMIFKELQAA